MPYKAFSSISDVFESLEYTTAPENDEAARAWLASHDHTFGMFINNKWHKPENREMCSSFCPATGEKIADTFQANISWAALPPHARSRHMYSITRHLQKHQRLLAIIESLDNGKTIRETRDVDIPLAIRHFYSHAADQKPLGVVGQIIPWNFPFLMLAWKIAPAIAMGNTVVLKPAPSTRLSVINVVSAFTGSTGVGKYLREITAGTGRKLSLELGGKNSAIEGLVNGIWFNQGQVCCAASRLLVQESIADTFLKKLKQRMKKLRLGMVQAFIDIGKDEELNDQGSFFPPTLVTNVQPTSSLVQNEIFGPVLVTQSFRTPEEAIALANNTKYGLSAGVWTENIGLAMEAAMSIKAGVVWINCHNLFDAAAGFGGFKESGFGREGGKEGLYQYTRPVWETQEVDEFPNSLGIHLKQIDLPSSKTFDRMNLLPTIDRTPKMYIGGKQKRPDGCYVKPIYSFDGHLLDQVGEGNRKDIRNAVEAARNAKPGWGKRAAHNRAQILYYIAENLNIRREEFGERIAHMTEVDAAIDRLFTYGAYADKYGGNVQETTLYGLTVSINEPVGVIGIICPDKQPLLSFVSLVAPAVVRGNTVVAVPSQKCPLAATDLYQVFDTSDLPGGVVNIVTGETDPLAKTLVEHQHVDAIWYHGSAEGSYHVERLSSGNMKRTVVNYGRDRDWFDEKQGAGESFLMDSTEVKTIWVPMGE
eukprot:GSMAST32.ASY1.ANO1.2678.1 assembled CDS